MSTTKYKMAPRRKSPYYKPLAVVEKDELEDLRMKKEMLEKKLKQIEQDSKENYIPRALPQAASLTPTIQNKTMPRSQPQQIQSQSTGSSVAELRKQEQIQREKEQLASKIEQGERERRMQQVQFDRVKDDLRSETMTLKEQAIKHKMSFQQSHSQVQELETQRAQLQKEVKKLHTENLVIQKQMVEYQKRTNESEALLKQSKSIQQERDDRIKWMEKKLEEEERRHQHTRTHAEQLDLKIKQQEQEMHNLIKDRERLSQDIEQISLKHNERYNELHEVRLKDRREANDLHLAQSEYQRVTRELHEKIRHLELERQRMLVRLDDLDRTQERLRQRDRQLCEVEVQLERLHREKGNVVIERIVREAPPLPSPPQVIYGPPQPAHEVPEDIIEMRRELLGQSQKIQRLEEDNQYWRRRVDQLEVAGDRAVDLMAHINLDSNQQAQKQDEQHLRAYTQLRTQTMAFINDLRSLANKLQLNQVQTFLANHRGFLDLLSHNK